MLRRTVATVAALCLFAALAPTNAFADETETHQSGRATAEKKSDGSGKSTGPTTKQKATDSAEKEAKTLPKVRRRLPRFFGKLQLDENQRVQVYSIQAEYQQQLDELQARITSLKLEREEQLRVVLTASQKRQLGSLEQPKSKPKTVKTSKSGRAAGKSKS